MITENSISVRTYAKINLALNVLGKRSDGYHSLKTIMQSVSLYDTIEVLINKTRLVNVECDYPGVPNDERNLAAQAVLAFFDYIEEPLIGVDITIKKNIPVKAGLGGGSSNAAGVLFALNELFGTKLSPTGLSTSQLCEIGITIGADVPFCIVGGTALCEGVGELITPLPPLDDCYIVIAKPDIGVSTSSAFDAYDNFPNPQHVDLDEFVAEIAGGNCERIAPLCANTLEDAVNIPEINEIKRIMMENNALCSVMSGTGSAVFGIFAKKRYASGCTQELEDFVNFVELCTPVNYSTEIK